MSKYVIIIILFILSIGLFMWAVYGQKSDEVSIELSGPYHEEVPAEDLSKYFADSQKQELEADSVNESESECLESDRITVEGVDNLRQLCPNNKLN